MKRYFLTAIGFDGCRHIIPAAQSIYGHDNISSARAYLKSLKDNNNPDRLKCIGVDIMINAVDCWDNGDPKHSLLS